MKYLQLSEAADRLSVSVATLRRWVDAGQIEAIRLPMRGDRRVSATDVERLLQDMAVKRVEHAE